MADDLLAAQWRERLSDRGRSGLSVRNWCISHNIPEHRYYYWQRKFSEGASAGSDTCVEWLALPNCPSPPASNLTVRVGSASIDIAPGFDAALLRAVVLALEASKC